MKLIGIRHGETRWNRERREMGQLDSPLTALGVRQAEAVADRLAAVEYAALYSSDLGRAVQTATAIASRSDREFLLDEGLRERSMGIFEGLTRAEMHERFPRERADYERIGFTYPVRDGESGRQRTERCVRTLTAIAERHPDDPVVVVSHGGILMGFLDFVLGVRPARGWRVKLHNASLSVFDCSAGEWAVDTWNDRSHLDRGMQTA